jgi:hypothetical protein
MFEQHFLMHPKYFCAKRDVHIGVLIKKVKIDIIMSIYMNL